MSRVALPPVACQQLFEALAQQLPDEDARHARECMVTGEPVGEREVLVIKRALLFARDHAVKLSEARQLHLIFRQISTAADNVPFVLAES